MTMGTFSTTRNSGVELGDNENGIPETFKLKLFPKDVIGCYEEKPTKTAFEMRPSSGGPFRYEQRISSSTSKRKFENHRVCEQNIYSRARCLTVTLIA